MPDLLAYPYLSMHAHRRASRGRVVGKYPRPTPGGSAAFRLDVARRASAVNRAALVTLWSHIRGRLTLTPCARRSLGECSAMFSAESDASESDRAAPGVPTPYLGRHVHGARRMWSPVTTQRNNSTEQQGCLGTGWVARPAPDAAGREAVAGRRNLWAASEKIPGVATNACVAAIREGKKCQPPSRIRNV